MNIGTSNRVGWAAICLAVAAAGCNGSQAARSNEDAADGRVTFNRDVAPIVWQHCAACHRPGQSAPFSLLTYRDAKKRAGQIAEITARRTMPPWLPAPGHGRFANERRLTADEIQTIATWHEQGAVEGKPEDLPQPPVWPDGWQLGKPDLVVQMTEPYSLRADGTDVFRNLVIPLPVDETRYVRAIEFSPGNARIVHHATIKVDSTGSSRRLDALDAEPGYDGMLIPKAHYPDGHFLGWTPGKVPSQGTSDMAWRLAPGMDFVLQLHLLPTGKPETISAKIGLYFADKPPTRVPSVISLGTTEIDIPAGAAEYEVRDRMMLPVDVELHQVYPHAHYLGKRLHGLATLPDGSRRWLIRIDEWDFNWQDEYRLAQPLHLPAGTTLEMVYTYDNSAANVRNPNDPPRRVAYGPHTSDEMADLILQVVTKSPDDRAKLERALYKREVRVFVAEMGRFVEDHPNDAQSQFALGEGYRTLGAVDPAIQHLREAVRLQPDFATAHVVLAVAYETQGDAAAAVESYRRALKADADHQEAHANLAWLLATHPSDAIRNGREALRLAQRLVDLTGELHPVAWDTLAAAHAESGQFTEAAKAAQLAIELAEQSDQNYLVDPIRARIVLYRKKQAFREPVK